MLKIIITNKKTRNIIKDIENQARDEDRQDSYSI